MTKLLWVTSLILLLIVSPFESGAKPFQRALVIGGGGITPGMALGMIAGAQAAGYNPDVIITSCGSSLGAALYGSFGSTQTALAYAKSEKFYKNLKSLVSLNSSFVFGMKSKLEAAYYNPDVVPFIFQGTIITVPPQVQSLLPVESFPSSPKKPRLVIVAARSSLGPEHQGFGYGSRPLFRETFITDPHTASFLKGFDSPVQKIFFDGRVDKSTETLTTTSLSQAVRASITDPYYVNPARIGKSYYWGGAVDLFPIETAQHLAQEVLVNFPSGLYSGYEDLAIFSTYGFAQSARTLEASKHTEVKWLDGSGAGEFALDPVPWGIFFVNKFPSNHEDYALIVHRQFRFGYERAMEAVRLQRNRNNVRTHLRYSEVGIR